jgi:hypothetical protein
MVRSRKNKTGRTGCHRLLGCYCAPCRGSPTQCRNSAEHVRMRESSSALQTCPFLRPMAFIPASGIPKPTKCSSASTRPPIPHRWNQVTSARISPNSRQLLFRKFPPPLTIYRSIPCTKALPLCEDFVAKLIFNGNSHQITLVDERGEIVGTWAAYNNVDRHATLTHIQNGSYAVTDRLAPRLHRPSADGPYGLHGIVRFNVPGHPGIGVHSGRANARNLPGPAHPTMGCIRTSDEAMMAIATSMSNAPLTTVEVVNNSSPLARAASHRNHRRRLQGRHRG